MAVHINIPVSIICLAVENELRFIQMMWNVRKTDDSLIHELWFLFSTEYKLNQKGYFTLYSAVF